MTYTRVLIAVALLVAFTAAAIQPAQAQTSDTWKSVAIIGGSTAAGAYIGHKVAGPTGTWIGAGVGASVGYAIDSRRRANEYRNQGYYDPNAGYYPDPNAGYYPPSGVYGGTPYPGSYPSGYPAYPGNGYASRHNSQRRGR
jgi:hypothetical protein